MAGFTTEEMVDMLSLRLEDENEDVFGAALKLQSLNWAQLELTNLIHMAYLVELEVKDFSITCALASSDDEGSIAFSELSKQPLANGIQRVKISGGNWAHMITADEVRKSINKWQRGTNKRPFAYVQRERIYLAASDDTQNIDVHYLREPEPMQAVFTLKAGQPSAQAAITNPASIELKHAIFTLDDADGDTITDFTADEFIGQTGYNKTQSCNFLVYDNLTTNLEVVFGNAFTFAAADEIYFTSADGTVTHLSKASCDLNPRLHSIVVHLAESQLWLSNTKAERSDKAYEKAISVINALNQRYDSEAPTGIGTEKR